MTSSNLHTTHLSNLRNLWLDKYVVMLVMVGVMVHCRFTHCLKYIFTEVMTIYTREGRFATLGKQPTIETMQPRDIGGRLQLLWRASLAAYLSPIPMTKVTACTKQLPFQLQGYYIGWATTVLSISEYLDKFYSQTPQNARNSSYTGGAVWKSDWNNGKS